MPLSNLIHLIHHIQDIAALITSQYTHGLYAPDAQLFNQLVYANMMSNLSDLIHHIHRIQHISTLIMSQYGHGVYNAQPFPSQLSDANIMSIYDLGEAHYEGIRKFSNVQIHQRSTLSPTPRTCTVILCQVRGKTSSHSLHRFLQQPILVNWHLGASHPWKPRPRPSGHTSECMDTPTSIVRKLPALGLGVLG